MAERTVTAAILIIGNEILSGRTKDQNLAWLAHELNEAGVRLMEARVVADIEAEIVSAIDALRARYTYVFTTGGIGPTHDDITSPSIAKAFGRKWAVHADAKARLLAHYDDPSMLNEARLRMATMPEGAELIDNPVSAAPGFRVENVYVLAGVPRIMQSMFDSIRPNLKGGPKVLSRTIICNLPEGTLAEGLGTIQRAFPTLDIGSYPAFRPGGFSVSIVIRGTDADLLQDATDAVMDSVRSLGGAPEVQAGER